MKLKFCFRVIRLETFYAMCRTNLIYTTNPSELTVHEVNTSINKLLD